MNQILQTLAEIWIGYKIRLVEMIGLTNDALHVHGSLLILFGSAIILRRRPDSIWCWLIVFIAELFNEFADLKGVAPGEATIDAAVHDLYNTMFWPTVIMLFARFIFVDRSSHGAAVPQGSSDLADQSLEQSPTV
jgi:hypothetical protein